jgi:hypothetical protein
VSGPSLRTCPECGGRPEDRGRCVDGCPEERGAVAGALSMDAGRELDMLVAEKVMGCQWRRFGNLGEVLSPPNSLHSWADTHRGERRPTFMLPAYSTDIAAAWEVVEAAGPFVKLTHGIALDGQTQGWLWECLLYRKDEVSPRQAFAHGVTAPLAICRAALAAVEVSA